MASYMKHILLPLAVCFIGQSWSAVLAEEGSLILPEKPGDNVELSLQDASLDLDAPGILQVFVGSPENCCTGKSPIAGKYNVDGRTVTFDPAFDFVSGQIYTVQSYDETIGLADFTIAMDGDVPDPEVVAIYPSGKEIPANTLRFYIQFSTPMTPHMADNFIKLVDANGISDTAAFMSFTQELWNEDRTRLTLLMDPGRIKRGVAQNVALGPALLEGNHYSIVIEKGWPGARGGQETPRFEKPFTVSAALRHLPDIDLWQIQAPKMTTGKPLVITFDRPFDQQLVQTAITVRDEQGRRIPGAVSVKNNEQTWRFQPDEPWATPTIRIVVDARLEDIAGNNFRDLLDHSVGTDAQAIDQQMIDVDLTPNPDISTIDPLSRTISSEMSQ